ncbi:redoxin domain-containing protein [Cardiosporidium cionae]|uniref:Redoxin domain-containing protein n=1 Tax=Cardiosporidium cionae TaxID=476202 RepID=A0ABQ7J485_9APIC|nr:redoxin domain-containing protein [Cardiosporidium cionae]|eukprot:KAF8817921.1 redoxin domain-containing protein [Cardiosporidium cionae]
MNREKGVVFLFWDSLIYLMLEQQLPLHDRHCISSENTMLVTSASRRSRFIKASNFVAWLSLSLVLLLFLPCTAFHNVKMLTKPSLLASSISPPRYHVNMVSEGSRAPQCTWTVRIPADPNKEETSDFIWSKISTDDIFKGKRVIIFGLPGAFTPTCSSQHLPGYEEMYDTFRQKSRLSQLISLWYLSYFYGMVLGTLQCLLYALLKGIDEIYCLSVNDPFVMNAWKKTLGMKKVKFLPDGNCEFSNSLGLLVDKNNLGFGRRTWRYSMVINDGIVEKAFIEPGKSHNAPEDPFKVSDAKSMLNYLENS